MKNKHILFEKACTKFLDKYSIQHFYLEGQIQTVSSNSNGTESYEIDKIKIPNFGVIYVLNFQDINLKDFGPGCRDYSRAEYYTNFKWAYRDGQFLIR